jgi:hypothetical protein
MTWAIFWKSLPLLLKYLPELMQFAKYIIGKAESGVADARIRRECALIMKAFKEEDPTTKAYALNNIFREIKPDKPFVILPEGITEERARRIREILDRYIANS